MTKIKISGLFVFLLSIILAFLSSHISEQNKINNNLLNTINEKKAFTQEISKNIFYIYRNKNGSIIQLEESIKNFSKNMSKNDELFNEFSSDVLKTHTNKISKLWNKFYLSVQNFRDYSHVTIPYTSILLESIVKDIYNTNLMLIVEFDKLIKIEKNNFENSLTKYKNIQYILFCILVLLLIYLFTQVKIIIAFIQKFSIVSKNIIKDSSIKNMEPIEIQKHDIEVSQVTNNFNYLVSKINKSIEFSTDSITHSHQSIELVEKNIEDLLELLSVMQEDKTIDKELTKKEDVIIQSLEELTSAAESLKALKTDLDNLISYNNLQKP